VNKRKHNRKPLIISLLLHLFFLLFILFFAFKNKPKILFSTKAKQKKEHYIPVALFPKQSDQGTKIVFDKATIIPKHEQKNAPPQPKQTEKIVEQKSQKIKEKIKQKKLAIPKKKIAKIKSVIPELKPKKEPKKEDKKIAKTMVETKVQDHALQETEIQKQVHITLPTTREIKQSQPTPKKRKSLLSLTKTFLDHEKGNSAMCRAGADRMPTFEEMKYICYEKQIQDALVSSWKMLYGRTYIQTKGETRFTFLINEHGKAEDIILTQTSGNKIFDTMVFESVSQAVFPPIPTHFGVKKYRPQGGIIVLR